MKEGNKVGEIVNKVWEIVYKVERDFPFKEMGHPNADTPKWNMGHPIADGGSITLWQFVIEFDCT